MSISVKSTRTELQSLCKRYKKAGKTTIDCRSADSLLKAELIRIGHQFDEKDESDREEVEVVEPMREKHNLIVPDYLLYEVLPHVPIETLLRFQLKLPPLFWSIRLTSSVPRELIPRWIDNPLLKEYSLRVRNELVGRVHINGGKYNASWDGTYNAHDMYRFSNLDQPIRLVSESGPFRFVGLEEGVYRFTTVRQKLNAQRIVGLKSKRITKIVGLRGYTIYLYGDGTTSIIGTHGDYPKELNSFGEPIIDVGVSSTHIAFKTRTNGGNNFYVVGTNNKEVMSDHSKVAHLPKRYGKLKQVTPLEVPEGTYRVIPGDSCTYALTESGTVFVMGNLKNYLGADSKGAMFIHEWAKVRLIGPAGEDLPLPPVVKLVTSFRHTVVLTIEGTVYGWGRFTAGEFGLSHQPVIPIIFPVKLFDEERCVDLGSSHWRSSVITENRNLYLWGAYEATPSGGGGLILSRYTSPKVLAGIKLCQSFAVGSLILV